jgi:hypothetical protein
VDLSLSCFVFSSVFVIVFLPTDLTFSVSDCPTSLALAGIDD